MALDSAEGPWLAAQLPEAAAMSGIGGSPAGEFFEGTTVCTSVPEPAASLAQLRPARMALGGPTNQNTFKASRVSQSGSYLARACLFCQV